MPTQPSFRSRLIEWFLWRLRFKRRFRPEGLRERVLKSRPRNPQPPRSLYRRFQVREHTSQGQRVFTLTPKKRPVELHVLYLHGGAFVYEMAENQWALVARLLKHANVSLTVPLYPLAPEHTCPEVLAFMHAAYEALREEAADKPIAVLGDSAGGALALALSQQLRDAGKPQPARLVLLSPWLDVSCSDPRQQALEPLDPILAIAGLREAGRWYAGDLAMTDPRVSPLYGDIHGLPPTLVLTGTHDLLNPDAHRLQAKMAAEAAPLTVLEYAKMLHVWPAIPIPEGTQAIRDVTAFLQAAGKR